MTGAERRAAAERLSAEARQRAPSEQAAFLKTACAGDDDLRREVESLLGQPDAAPTRSLLGRRLGGYEVVSFVGAGGMGVVFRGRDLSLGREVAIKFLPPEFASDPMRLARLDREARLLASLNHPGIATLFGLEEAEGQRFLVMELVSGPTLAERLQRGPLPVREAIAVARQMAEALEAAHEKGVVHRDLKPANVKITPEGRVKLLDFGLAKALEPSSTEVTSTQVNDVTREGAIVGTPAYMSPEQARGQPIDRRTDVWGFGCCFYESLTGRMPFTGGTASDTFVAILEREPDWSALPDGLSEGARRLVHRCLAKDVRGRLQHIGDARVELEDADAVTATTRAPVRPHARAIRPLPLVAAALAGGALAAALAVRGPWRTGSAPVAERPVARLTLAVPADSRDLRLSVHRFFVPFAISPDASRLVFHARGAKGSQLFLRELSGYEVKPLPGTEQATTPFFSPDGRWIGFWRAEDRLLRKVSISGGPTIEVGPTDAPQSAWWLPGDEIVFETGLPTPRLWSIPTGGGAPREIAIGDRSPGERISLRGPLPGGRDLLVASMRGGDDSLDVLSRETGKRRRLLRGGRSLMAAYVRTGHVVYADGDALFAVPVDPARLEPVGDPVPVIDGVDHYLAHANAAVSEAGALVYLAADRVREAQLVWLDRSGVMTPVPGGQGSIDPNGLALSPSGHEAAVTVLEGTRRQVWSFDLERGTRSLLTAEGDSRSPIFSRDGAFITFASDRGGEQTLDRRRLDATGEPERVVGPLSGWAYPEDWSPDGRSLLFTQWTARGDSDVWVQENGVARPLIATRYSEESPRFSPDGRFIAFHADDGGVSHVYIQPFPGPGPRTAVSAELGGFPRWGPDGRELFYLNGTRMRVASVETRPALKVGAVRTLFEGGLAYSFLVAPGARRFLTVSLRAAEAGPIE
ncbi:MAG TPA: protein kinase, partial [Vicinamibacteria bacterium]|nr:protein kinase [Vicinamibacteria bacterium]